MQQSKIGLTSVLYNINIPFIPLLATFLLISPIILLADLHTLLQFTVGLHPSVKKTPRSFISFTFTITCPSILYTSFEFFFPTCISQRLLTLNGISLSFDHLESLFKSSFIDATSSLLFTFPHNFVSSAKLSKLLLKP